MVSHYNTYDEFTVLNLRQLFLLNGYIRNCSNYNLHRYPTRMSNRTNIILPRVKTAQIVGLKMAIKYGFNYDQLKNVRPVKRFLIDSGFLRVRFCGTFSFFIFILLFLLFLFSS